MISQADTSLIDVRPVNARTGLWWNRSNIWLNTSKGNSLTYALSYKYIALTKNTKKCSLHILETIGGNKTTGTDYSLKLNIDFSCLHSTWCKVSNQSIYVRLKVPDHFFWFLARLPNGVWSNPLMNKWFNNHLNTRWYSKFFKRSTVFLHQV